MMRSSKISIRIRNFIPVKCFVEISVICKPSYRTVLIALIFRDLSEISSSSSSSSSSALALGQFLKFPQKSLRKHGYIHPSLTATSAVGSRFLDLSEQ